MNYERRCNICSTPLPGRKGHGFVTSSGVICSDFKRHERLRRQQKKNKLLDTEVQDMLFFRIEMEVSKDDERLLIEVN